MLSNHDYPPDGQYFIVQPGYVHGSNRDSPPRFLQCPTFVQTCPPNKRATRNDMINPCDNHGVMTVTKTRDQ